MQTRPFQKRLWSVHFSGDQLLNFLIEAVSLTEPWREFPLKFFGIDDILRLQLNQIRSDPNEQEISTFDITHSTAAVEIPLVPPDQASYLLLKCLRARAFLNFLPTDHRARPIPTWRTSRDALISCPS